MTQDKKRVLHVWFCFQDQKRVIALYGERNKDERRVKLHEQVDTIMAWDGRLENGGEGNEGM